MKLDFTGCSTISPFGLRSLKLALVAAVICTSASRQISWTLPRRSSSERKPLLYSSRSCSTMASCEVRISAFSFLGTTMSFLETGTEDGVQAFLDAHIEQRAADGGHDALAQGQAKDDGPARELGDAGLALGGHLALVEDALFPGALRLVVAAVGDERLAEVVGLGLAEVVLGVIREVVHADDHVLAGHGDGLAVRRRQDVVGAQHEHAGLGLRLPAQRQVHGHLVAVEVGVERRADERVDLDGLTLDEQRLEGLDAEAVQGGRPVEQHGVPEVWDILEEVITEH